MDKALIFDVFDFVGFHICKALLNNGIEVRGFHLPEKDDEIFIDEKRLEIGRNANFMELNELSNGVEKRHLANGTLILSFYDLFMHHKERLLRNEITKEQFSQLLKKREGKNESTVFLLPIQMLSESFDFPGVLDIQHFIKQVGDLPRNVKFIFLPTIFGPWQPATYLFQHTILSSLNKHSDLTEIREAATDALFIDDAIGSILEIIETGRPGKYVIETGQKKQWERCASFLNIDPPKNVLREWKVDSDIIFVKPNKLTSIADSISEQINHIKQLLAFNE
jgi:hypothetical protein